MQIYVLDLNDQVNRFSLSHGHLCEISVRLPTV